MPKRGALTIVLALDAPLLCASAWELATVTCFSGLSFIYPLILTFINSLL